MKIRSLRILFAIPVFLLCVSTLFAQKPVNRFEKRESKPVPQRPSTAVMPGNARKAAKGWLKRCPVFSVDGTYTPAVDIIQIKDKNKTRVIVSIIELQPKGFIVIAPDQEINPVIAFSEHAFFDSTDAPENVFLVLLRDDMAGRLQALEAGYIPSARKMKSQTLWDNLIQADAEQQAVSQDEGAMAFDWEVEVGPFLTSTWSQSGYAGDYIWNYYTPYHYVCGCVATAMGQILNYYEWPVTGTGSYSYTWDNGSDPAEVLSADFGSTIYDWSSMLDDYATTTTGMQREAVGKLVYHCGVAVDMYYTSGGSGAFTSEVAGALTNYFRTSGEYVSNTGDFYDRLYDNMLNERPAELSISRPGGGHAVVADGVRHEAGGMVYFHLNMGWFGTDNTWYNLPDISTPSGNPDYNTVNGAVMDIVPTPELNDPGATVTDPSLILTWDVSDRLYASQYELQEAILPNSLTSYTDGAEGGTDNWLIDGHWEQSNAYAYSGDYSFHGETYNGTTWQYPGTFTLDKMVKIDVSTTIDYWFRLYLFNNYEAYFQISDDFSTWIILRTYFTSTNDPTENPWDHVDWTLETISSAELANYAGETVMFRFVINYLGGTIYYGSPGIYVDDFSINDCSYGEWAPYDDNISTTTKTVPLGMSGDYCYRTRANWDAAWWNWSNIIQVTADLTVETPTFDPVADVYASARDVTINCATAAATIYYTTDGSDPTESGTVYSTPVNISENTTLRARAYRTDWNPSAIATGDYDLNLYSDTESISGTGVYTFNETAAGGDGHELVMDITSATGSGTVTVDQVTQSPGDCPGTDVCGLYWNITKASGITGFSADISFRYTEDDVTGFTESSAFLGIAKFNASTNTWTWLGGTVDAGANTITVNGVTSFSEFALFRRIFGDITGDGYVDASDLQRLGDCWHDTNSGEFTGGSDARFFNFNNNTDGGNQIIDAADLQVFGDCWHNGTP